MAEVLGDGAVSLARTPCFHIVSKDISHRVYLKVQPLAKVSIILAT